MPLIPGTQFGQYVIVGLVGAGGMGEVYRAKDNKLNRDVGVKILRDAFARDPDRLARFRREAHVLAALNHPNIGSIYGLEESGDRRALILELVEGQTLAERIAAGAIPLDEVLSIAGQIAEALEAAHEHGIVHRDLKPANIKLRPDGTVKVLDFGLAKAFAPDTSDTSDAGSGPTHSATPTTKQGAILGTTAYMSPEQARGRPVDKRTDIWAFGCVLYEMLTGQPTFTGEDDSETFARIIERDPDLAALPAGTPPAVRRLLRRALDKNQGSRLRDIGDARIELIEAAGRGAEDERGEIRATAGRRRRELVAWSVAFAALIGLVAIAMSNMTRNTLDPPRIARTQILLPRDQELDIAFRAAPLAASPDGQRLVYAAQRDGRTELYLRDLSKLEATVIPGTTGASQPFFSPDGQWVAFFARGMLQRVALRGGAPLSVCEVAGTIRGGTWGNDDVIVFATTSGGLQAVAAAGGTPRRLADTEIAAWPERLPDSATVLFVTGEGIAAVSLDGGSPRVIARTIVDADDPSALLIGPGQLGPVRFVPPGYLVFGHGAYRMRVAPFDPSSLRLMAAPISIADSLYRSADGGALYFAVSANGTLVYAPEDARRRLAWVTFDGSATPIGSDHQAFRYPHLSADGRYVAVDINTEERRSDIWIYDSERLTRTRMTSDEHSLLPLWHPSQSDLTYYRQPSGQFSIRAGAGTFELVRRRADGTGSVDTLAVFTTPAYPTSWSPDGRMLLLTVDNPATGYDLWELPEDATQARPLLERSAVDAWARFSPDGRWLAYMSDDSGTEEVYVVRYPEMTGHVRVSTRGGNWPVWAPDGSALYYRQGNAVMAVTVMTTPELVLGAPEQLFAGAYAGVDGDRKFDIAPDGKRFLMIEHVDPAASRQLVVVQNWFEELESLR